MKSLIDENIWQILKIDSSGVTKLHSWYVSQEKAEEELDKAKELFDFINVWVEKGTDYIAHRCQACGSIYAGHRYDLNGNRRGFWCLDCYKDDDVFIYPRPDDHVDTRFNSLTSDDD